MRVIPSIIYASSFLMGYSFFQLMLGWFHPGLATNQSQGWHKDTQHSPKCILESPVALTSMLSVCRRLLDCSENPHMHRGIMTQKSLPARESILQPSLCEDSPTCCTIVQPISRTKSTLFLNLRFYLILSIQTFFSSALSILCPALQLSHGFPNVSVFIFKSLWILVS